MMDKALQQFLIIKGLWDDRSTAKALTGGYWNRVYKVTTGDRQIVIKQFSTEAADTLFPNFPADEAKALLRLRGLRIAPDLIGFWPQKLVMAYEYVEGSRWKGDLSPIAEILIRKEAADPSGFRTLPTEPEAIMREGDHFFRKCKAGPETPRPEVMRIEPPARLSLLHTDIGPGNLIGESDGTRIIDWQCPGMGDLTEDVYSVLSPAFQILSECKPLTPDQIDRFFHLLGMPHIRRRYNQLRPAFAWRMAGYCAYRAETADDPAVRERYRQALSAELREMEVAP